MSDPAARARLGHGLALTPPVPGEPGRDLAFGDGPGGAALAVVEGADALGQDLAVALATPAGTNPFDVGFGFEGLRVLTLPVEPGLVEELLRLSVVRTLVADRRVREVLEVDLEPVGPDRTQRITAVVRAATGATVALDLGEVDL